MEIENYTDNNTSDPIDYEYVIQLTLIYEKIQFYALILTISIGIPGKKTNAGLLYTLLCTLNLITILW